MTSVPGVGEPDSSNNWEGEDSPKKDLCEARERLISDDRPIKSYKANSYVDGTLIRTRVST